MGVATFVIDTSNVYVSAETVGKLLAFTIPLKLLYNFGNLIKDKYEEIMDSIKKIVQDINAYFSDPQGFVKERIMKEEIINRFAKEGLLINLSRSLREKPQNIDYFVDYLLGGKDNLSSVL